MQIQPRATGSRRDLNRSVRRARMLDATLALAAEGGYEAVQMRAVADRAGVALGTLYRYFDSKVLLLLACLERHFDAVAASTSHRVVSSGLASSEEAGPDAGALSLLLGSPDPVARVSALLDHCTAGLREPPGVAEAMTRAYVFADSTAKQAVESVGLTLVGLVIDAARGQDEPWPAGSPEEFTGARVVVDIWISAQIGWVTGRTTPAEADAHIVSALRLLIRSGA